CALASLTLGRADRPLMKPASVDRMIAYHILASGRSGDAATREAASFSSFSIALIFLSLSVYLYLISAQLDCRSAIFSITVSVSSCVTTRLGCGASADTAI